MRTFNEGDLVFIDFGNGEYDNLEGLFVHDNMRPLQGKTFAILSVYGDDRYAIRDDDGDRLPWTFSWHWLTLSNMVPTSPEVECYNGEMHRESRCYLLTEPSEFAGMYAPWAESQEIVVQNPRRHVVMLSSEISDMMIRIEGDYYLRSETDEDEWVYCDAGSHRGQNLWLDNSAYVDDNVYHEDDNGRYFWYDDNIGDYTTDEPCDEDEDEDSNRHAYHNGPRRDYSDGAKFRFGVEVEKEDDGPLDNHSLGSVDRTGWSRECDSSLNDDTGYELVSPTYDLFGDRFDTDISTDILSEHINACKSNRCGGHMGFSIKGKSGPEAFAMYNGFFPILISMYRGRLTSSGGYSKFFNSKTLKRGAVRSSAVNVRREYIEFRVFSAVRDVTNLTWRRDLLRIMASNSKKGVMWWLNQAMNPNAALHNHLLKVYTEHEIMVVCAYAAAIAERMNGRDYSKYVSFADEDVRTEAKRFVNNL